MIEKMISVDHTKEKLHHAIGVSDKEMTEGFAIEVLNFIREKKEVKKSEVIEMIWNSDVRFELKVMLTWASSSFMAKSGIMIVEL